ncbi:MAG: GreA/GreB family elongation factor, partial [Phycisphaerae bacterium]
EALGPIATPAVGRMLQQSAQPAQALATLPDVQLWQTAVDAIRRELPADWPQIYLTALSVAPPQVCDMLAAALLSDNRAAQLQSAIEAAMARPAEHVGSLIWLWHGPQLTRPLALPSRIELLLRMLSALDELAEVPPAQRALAQAARSRIRSAILAEKGGLLRRCLERLDDVSLAAALRRQVQRCGGLSAAARQDMLEAIQQAFPRLFVRSSDHPWDQPDVLYVTAQSWSRKEQELRQLVEVKLRDNARAIGEAAARGDLSENSEYKFALEERDLLRARIGRIQSQMAIARIITPADVPTDQVGVGSRVTLRNDQTNQTLEITILGPWEADIERGIYNYQAPAARRLLGLRPGQTVSLPIGGQEVQYRIERVAVALE